MPIWQKLRCWGTLLGPIHPHKCQSNRSLMFWGNFQWSKIWSKSKNSIAEFEHCSAFNQVAGKLVKMDDEIWWMPGLGGAVGEAGGSPTVLGTKDTVKTGLGVSHATSGPGGMALELCLSGNVTHQKCWNFLRSTWVMSSTPGHMLDCASSRQWAFQTWMWVLALLDTKWTWGSWLHSWSAIPPLIAITFNWHFCWPSVFKSSLSGPIHWKRIVRKQSKAVQSALVKWVSLNHDLWCTHLTRIRWNLSFDMQWDPSRLANSNQAVFEILRKFFMDEIWDKSKIPFSHTVFNWVT